MDSSNKFDIKYAPTVTFPCTLKTIVNNVWNQVGVTLNSDFFNCDYVIKNDSAIAEDVTCRKVIIAVAELMGEYARINTLGKLEFFYLAIKYNDYFAAGTEVVYTSDDSNILDSIVGQTYTFDGTGFSLGGKTGDVVKHTNSGSEYNFADGSKAVIDKDGFYNLIGTTKNEYHHLTKVYRMTPTTNKKFTMTLPDEFKGKKFYLAPSVTIINKPIGSEPWLLSYLEIQAEPLSYEEGTIQIWCYSMWVNQNTGSTEITIPTMTLLVIA